MSLKLDTITFNQLTQLEAMQQETAKTNSIDSRTKISNQMLEFINQNGRKINDKLDIQLLKSQARNQTLDEIRSDNLKANADISDALDRNASSNNKLLRDLNTALGGLGNKLDDLKPTVPDPDAPTEDSGLGKVTVDSVDRTIFNGLFSDDKLVKLRDDTAALEDSLQSVITSNISSLKNVFTVNVTGGSASDLGFNISRGGKSIAVANPLTTWSKYYGEIGLVIMMLAAMGALVIVCSKN